MEECPFCYKPIEVGDLDCPHCGANLEEWWYGDDDK